MVARKTCKKIRRFGPRSSPRRRTARRRQSLLMRPVSRRHQVENRIDEFVSDLVEQRFRAPCDAHLDIPPARGGQSENRALGTDLEVLPKVWGAESACRLPAISRRTRIRTELEDVRR